MHDRPGREPPWSRGCLTARGHLSTNLAKIKRIIDRPTMTNQLVADPRFPNVLIHESSYIDDHVTIGEDTSIWHFCHILSGVKIGRSCRIGQNVMIGPKVTIGN